MDDDVKSIAVAVVVLVVFFIALFTYSSGLEDKASDCRRHGGAYVKSISPTGYTCIGENK